MIFSSSMSAKVLRATVEQVEKTTVVLESGGKDIFFPRALMPARIALGDVITLTLAVDHSAAERDERATELDDMTSRRIGSRKRGNPRSASARGKKK